MTSANKSLENFALNQKIKFIYTHEFTCQFLTNLNKIVYSVAKCFPEIKLSTRWSVAERLSTLSQHLNHRVENVIKQLVHTSAVRSSRYEGSGKFGEHERCVRVARDVAESNSSFLSIYPICIRQTKFQPFFFNFSLWKLSIFSYILLACLGRYSIPLKIPLKWYVIRGLKVHRSRFRKTWHFPKAVKG